LFDEPVEPVLEPLELDPVEEPGVPGAVGSEPAAEDDDGFALPAAVAPEPDAPLEPVPPVPSPGVVDPTLASPAIVGSASTAGIPPFELP
jgi:hypothetical protein